MASSSDVCVIGGGVVGLAAAVTLRERGIDAVCLERAVPGQGQSAGRTRQFRHLHRDPELIGLAVRAREGWRAWEERAGCRLLGSEGALRAGGEPGELDALRAAGVPAERLDPAAAMARLPIAAHLPDGLLWDPHAGAIRAEETVAALARWLGPALVSADVTGIDADADAGSVTVRSTAGTHRGGRCIVCAGAGTDRLVRRLGMPVVQDRQAHLRLCFRIRAGGGTALPCLSDRTGGPDEWIYGLTDLGDRYAVGLARATTYPPVRDLATDVPGGVDLTAQRARIIAYVRRRLPGLDPEPADDLVRLTTTLPGPEEDGFQLWREGPIVALAGPNLFKFAPVLGARLADAATAPSAASGAPA